MIATRRSSLWAGLSRRDAVALVVTILVAILGISQVSDEPPCQGVDETLDPDRKAALDRAVFLQFKQDGWTALEKVSIEYSLRYGGWTALSYEVYIAEGGWVFYRGDPLTTRFVMEWGGANGWNEGPELNAWVMQNAPGIPPKLAACFVSGVTPDPPSEDEIRNLPKS